MAPLRLLTVGHSNHTLEHFLELLTGNGVEVLADVRSHPDATYLPHFAASPLRAALAKVSIRSVFLGEELGGRPAKEEYYDPDGHVLYGRWARSRQFRDGLARLVGGCRRYRVAIMCSEEDPRSCHRRLLVCRALLLQGTDVQITHIRGDAQLEPEDVTRLRALDTPQIGLFDAQGVDAWRSTRSVSRRSRPAGSSAF
ncbi:MAG: hypothetical protein QOE72_4632 [Chloroflexota bacterium]|nr:hypothetical protein [Chloroflexota bacterium]